MDAMTFALDKKEKKQLDAIAHELSIKEGKKVTNGELVRRAIRQAYGLSPDGKQQKAGESNRKRRK
jgi:alanine dehydrogenase